MEYKEFMDKYEQEHYCCPKCHSRHFSCTLVGYIYNSDHPEEYKDRNSVHCFDCGWSGIRHDLAPKPGINEFKEKVKDIAGIYYSEEAVDELLNIAKKIYEEP